MMRFLIRCNRLYCCVGATLALGLARPAAGLAASEERPLPRTLEEARTWWSGTAPAPFVAPAPPAAPPRLSPIEQRKQRLLEGAGRLIRRLELPLEVGGYSALLRPDEEYRLSLDPDGRRATVIFGDAFWTEFFRRTEERYDYATFLVYVLLRAGADQDYRRHFDEARCAWMVQGQAETLTPSLRVLRQAIEAPPTSWLAPDGPVYQANEDFRRQLDAEGNPARVVQALVSYALGAVAQRAADQHALEEYRRLIGRPTAQIRERHRQRERALAWDFSRARSAMTLAERMAFRNHFRSAFQLAATPSVRTTRAGEP